MVARKPVIALIGGTVILIGIAIFHRINANLIYAQEVTELIISMNKKTKSKATLVETAPTAHTSTGFWLAKSEPDVYGIADLKRDKRTLWEGVRNYQARNFMRAMKKGDRVLFYHSNANPSGVAGVATVCALAQPDHLQFDKRSEFFDAGATMEQPRWSAVELAFETEFARVITLEELRAVKSLSHLLILQRGNRLSVTPVQPAEFRAICDLA